jgi:glycosyltransferase involved in cell wall biosynthesis
MALDLTDSSRKNPKSISIVVPIFREAPNLRTLVAQVRDAIGPGKEDLEFIFIDDGSPDESWSVIKTLVSEGHRIRARKLSRNFGKEAALRAGLELSRGEITIVMDADLQHPPHVIPKMISAWQTGNFSIIEAVKAERGRESLLSRFRARLFYSIFNRLSGFDLKGSSDFKLLDRNVLDEYLKLPERNLYFRGLSTWMGYRTHRIAFAVAERHQGVSAWSGFRLFKLAVVALTSFSSIPLHLITFIGLGFAGFAMIMAAQTLYLKAIGEAVSGFSTVILLILILGSVLMFALGIVGEYLARIYEEVKKRPTFVIEETIESI